VAHFCEFPTMAKSSSTLRRRAQAQARANNAGASSTSSSSAASPCARHAVVMVLGDVGRSPRMQYHALSLARMDPQLRVSLLGYEGERCVPDVYETPNIGFLTFTPRLQRLPRGKFFVLLAPFKVLVQLMQLLWLLLVTAGSIDLVLLQNPPTYV
jgi:beta-1,4-mannosyltransferase